MKQDVIAISVVIATYNRSEDLRLTLGCLQNQKLPENVNYEVLIIDNNSNDNTKDVVESCAPSFEGKLTYLFEPTQGQSFAHNSGIRGAEGKIIVLTDDDCTFDTDYLARIYETFKEYGDSIGFIGGKCAPRWVNCSKPEWFVNLRPGWWSKEFFWGPLAILDYGETPFAVDYRQVDVDGRRLFYGANMAVRKKLFSKHGDFDVRRPITQDTELQLRFLRRGERGLYTPRIKVYHKVSPERLTPRYYYRWYFLRGSLLEIQEKYQRKFYHPFGIQFAFIFRTLKLFLSSFLVRTVAEKVYRRSHGLFNLGQMIQIARVSDEYLRKKDFTAEPQSR